MQNLNNAPLKAIEQIISQGMVEKRITEIGQWQWGKEGREQIQGPPCENLRKGKTVLHVDSVVAVCLHIAIKTHRTVHQLL